MSIEKEPDHLLRAITGLDQQILHLKGRMRELSRKPPADGIGPGEVGDIVREIARLVDLKGELRKRLSSARALAGGR